MESMPTFEDLLNVINGGSEDMKANCQIGLFAVEYMKDAQTENDAEQEVNHCFLRKPVVLLEAFAEQNKLYYEARFVFRSCDDSDYKQMKNFICRYANTARAERRMLEDGRDLHKLTSLRMSIIPEKYHGKYYLTLDDPYWETVSFTELPFDQGATISFILAEDGVAGYIADDDVIDPRAIQREIDSEIEAEYGNG